MWFPVGVVLTSLIVAVGIATFTAMTVAGIAVAVLSWATWSRPVLAVLWVGAMPIATVVAETVALDVRIPLVLVALLGLARRGFAPITAYSPAVLFGVFGFIALQFLQGILQYDGAYGRVAVQLAIAHAAIFLLGASLYRHSSSCDLAAAFLALLLVFVFTSLPSQVAALGDAYRHAEYIPRGSGALAAPGGPNLVGTLAGTFLIASLHPRLRFQSLGTVSVRTTQLAGVVVLFLSYSRRAWVGVVVAVVFLAVAGANKHRLRVGGAALAAAFGLALLTVASPVIGRDLAQRLSTYEYGVTVRQVELDVLSGVSAQELLIGRGPGASIQYDYASDAMVAIHNSYVAAFVDYGAISLLLLMLASGFAVLHGSSRWGPRSWFAPRAALLLILITGIAGEMFLYSSSSSVFWLLLGLSSARSDGAPETAWAQAVGHRRWHQ